MRRLLAGLASVAMLSGCPDKPKDATTPDDGFPHPLSAADREALGAPEGLAELLPEGPKTPVRLLRSENDTTPYGFWFSVNPQRASFVVHAMRRAVRRLAPAADAGTPENEAPPASPFVYEAGASGDGRTKIVVILRHNGESDAVYASAAVDGEQFVEFLDTWREKTGATVYAATKDRLELEIDRLPPDENTFLNELSKFTVDPTGWNDGPIPRPIRQLRDSLEKDHRISLP